MCIDYLKWSFKRDLECKSFFSVTSDNKDSNQTKNNDQTSVKNIFENLLKMNSYDLLRIQRGLISDQKNVWLNQIFQNKQIIYEFNHQSIEQRHLTIKSVSFLISSIRSLQKVIVPETIAATKSKFAQQSNLEYASHNLTHVLKDTPLKNFNISPEAISLINVMKKRNINDFNNLTKQKLKLNEFKYHLNKNPSNTKSDEKEKTNRTRD